MWLILGNIFYSAEPEGFGDASGKEFPTCDTSFTSFKEEQCQLLLAAPCYKPVFQRKKKMDFIIKKSSLFLLLLSQF